MRGEGGSQVRAVGGVKKCEEREVRERGEGRERGGRGRDGGREWRGKGEEGERDGEREMARKKRERLAATK